MHERRFDEIPAAMSRREWRDLFDAPGASSDAPPTAAADAPQLLFGAPPVEVVATTPTVLAVCTGNICRSPMAEMLLRARLGALGIRVHSAGTQALVDHGMTEPAQELAVQLGAQAADAAAHKARYLVEPLLRESDLVLAMSREHRSHTVQMMPSMLRRVFTVREFARLASTLSSDEAKAAADAAGSSAQARLRAVVSAVGAQRGLTPANGEDDDVIDPYRRSRTTYELSASQLAPAVDEVERVIRAALS